MKLKLCTFVSLNIFRMQRIRDKQKKYRAGRKPSEESSEPDTAGRTRGRPEPASATLGWNAEFNVRLVEEETSPTCLHVEAVSLLWVKVLPTILGLQKVQESIRESRNVRKSTRCYVLIWKEPLWLDTTVHHSSPAFQRWEMAQGLNWYRMMSPLQDWMSAAANHSESLEAACERSFCLSLGLMQRWAN